MEANCLRRDKMKNLSELDTQLKQEEQTWDAIQGEFRDRAIPEDAQQIHQCEHTPDLLEPIKSEYKHDQIIQVLRCQCGMTIKEYFTYQHTNVCE